MSEKAIVIWGAGRIGRGFVAELFHAADYRLILVDQSEALVETLRQAGCYTVARVHGATDRQDVKIAGYQALSIRQTQEVIDAIVGADLVAIAVFPKAFADVARHLVPCLLARWERRPGAPLDILLCTNLVHAGPHFKALLWEALPPERREEMEGYIGIVETLVIRIAPDPPADLHRRDPLLVWTNGYPELPIDQSAFRGQVPAVPGLRLVADMHAEEMRKLYTYNTFHAALAYLGALSGHALIADCMADPVVRTRAVEALDEAAGAVQAEYGFAADDMVHWIQDVIWHTDNPVLGDTVRRFGADPRRKLGRDDRLIGPLLLARQHGRDPAGLVRAAAAALYFDAQGDDGAAYVGQRIDVLGLQPAIADLCGLESRERDLIERIAGSYARLPHEMRWARQTQAAYERGFEYEKVYHGCGQCVLAAAQDTLELVDEAAFGGAFEAATGLAGGVGLCGDGSCSAFTGGAMALGLFSPRRRSHFGGDRDNKYRAYELIQQLHERFVQRYGGIRCHDVHRRELGRAFDLRDPDEREAFEAAGAHADKCTGVVARAARWVVEIVGEAQEEDASDES